MYPGRLKMTWVIRFMLTIIIGLLPDAGYF